MHDSPAFNSNEVITAQFGPQSNKVAAHFWNLQMSHTSIDPQADSNDVPFDWHVLSEGSEGNIRPRTLAVDLPSSVKFGLSLDSPPNPINKNVIPWSGNVDVISRCNGSPSKIKDTKLDTQWLTCLPRPMRRCWNEHGLICSVPENSVPSPLKTEADQGVILSSYFQGLALASPGSTFADNLEDQFRKIAERCSRPTGIQVVVDAENVFSGIASRFLDHISDEFPKRPVLCVAVCDSATTSRLDPKRQRIANANHLALLTQLEPSEDSFSRGAWLPLSISPLKCTEKPCRTTSVIAAAWDATTSWMKADERFGGVSLDHFITSSQLSHGRRMLSASVGYSVPGENHQKMTWSHLNPHRLASSCELSSSESCFWRQIISRGVTIDQIGDGASRPNSIGNISAPDSLVFIREKCPAMKPGAHTELISSLQIYSLDTSFGKRYANPWCHQPPSIRMISVLNVPGDNSAEALGLKKIVNKARSSSSVPSDDVERDVWYEYLEQAQKRLVNSYSGNEVG
ncbi:unnamed protein product [Dicrocoelium dendriticum]|nr:unnamed protein product [Dicrocoelium dendriticum]